MAKVILIKTSGDLVNAIRSLGRFKKRLPSMTRVGMRKWGSVLERDMKLSAREARIRRFTGTLQGLGIRWEQGVRSNTGFLFMRLYGIFLDSMSPHYINVSRRRTRLLQWAKFARRGAIRRKATMVERGKLKSFSIYVKPHPFIARGFRRARTKLNPILKKALDKSLNI